jgi:hypothetical protein
MSSVSSEIKCARPASRCRTPRERPSRDDAHRVHRVVLLWPRARHVSTVIALPFGEPHGARGIGGNRQPSEARRAWRADDIEAFVRCPPKRRP